MNRCVRRTLLSTIRGYRHWSTHPSGRLPEIWIEWPQNRSPSSSQNSKSPSEYRAYILAMIFWSIDSPQFAQNFDTPFRISVGLVLQNGHFGKVTVNIISQPGIQNNMTAHVHRNVSVRDKITRANPNSANQNNVIQLLREICFLIFSRASMANSGVSFIVRVRRKISATNLRHTVDFSE